MRKFISPDLLILDDFGLRRLDALQSSDLYELIIERHKQASTLFTSNRGVEEWVPLFYDPILAQSALRALGRKSLGLSYALVGTDTVLASIIPSNSARAGGIVFPIVRSLAEAYDSTPGESRRRLGAYLMIAVYQCDVIACAMFLTGQASNVLIAKFAFDVTGVELTYGKWLLAGMVPGLVALLLVPWVIYRLFPPEVKETPHAAEFAQRELTHLGAMSRGEKLMLAVFVLVALLWMTPSVHGIHYAVVAIIGVAVLLLTKVLEWQDLITERGRLELHRPYRDCN